MAKQLSTVTVLERRVGGFILQRTDMPDEHEFVWCGKALGWRPWNSSTVSLAHVYPTQLAAELASDTIMRQEH